MKDLPSNLTELADPIMSNFNHKVNPEIAGKVVSGEYFAPYTAWNFYGEVWFEKESNKWLCKIKRFGDHIDTIEADSPHEILIIASDRYGSD